MLSRMAVYAALCGVAFCRCLIVFLATIAILGVIVMLYCLAGWIYWEIWLEWDMRRREKKRKSKSK